MEVLAIGFLGNLLNYYTIMYSYLYGLNAKQKPNIDLTQTVIYSRGENYVRQIDNIS